MHELYNIINLSSEGSKGLAKIHTIEQLKELNLNLTNLDEANNKAFNSISLGNGEVVFELAKICKVKEKIISLKKVVDEAIRIHELKNKYEEGSLMVVSHNKINIAVAEHIVIQQQDLKSVEKEIDLGTSINTDKQFFYNCRQNNMEVTNELSFEVDMMFEPLAPIPLRLKYNSNLLNKEISFDVSFF